jgi:hypothetical protein
MANKQHASPHPEHFGGHGQNPVSNGIRSLTPVQAGTAMRLFKAALALRQQRQ